MLLSGKLKYRLVVGTRGELVVNETKHKRRKYTEFHQELYRFSLALENLVSEKDLFTLYDLIVAVKSDSIKQYGSTA